MSGRPGRPGTRAGPRFIAPGGYVGERDLLASMKGHVVSEERDVTEPLFRFTRLAEQQRQAGAGNAYQSRFFNFLAHCVWTIDEARGGQVRRWPTGLGEDGRSWDQVWVEVEHALLTRKLLFIEKSRRVLASWCVCAWDVWLAAGGQDPRWQDESGRQTLMLGTENRRVIVAARKAEGFGGSEWYLRDRIRVLLEQFELHECRRLWPDFPLWEARAGEIAFSNGAYITGVPQGADQARGPGATHLHCEEVAFWEEAAATIGAAIPVMRGGGHITCVTTPKVGTYAKDLRDGTLRDEELVRGSRPLGGRP